MWGKQSMKLTIIVPVYNCVNTINRTIESIKHQLNDNIELIIVNDGSTDGTGMVIEKYINSVNNAKIISKKNNGVVSARYAGLLESLGEYIWFVDGGDKIADEAVSILFENFQKDIDVFFFDFIEQFNSDLKIIRQNANNELDIIKQLLLGNIVPSVWSKVYKRELLLQCCMVKDYDLVLGEDLLLNLEYFTLCKKKKKIHKQLYYYIRENNSITLSGEKVSSILMAMDKLKEFLLKESLYDNYKAEADYLIFCQLIINYILHGKNRKMYKEILIKYNGFNINIFKNNKLKNKFILLVFAKIKVFLNNH